MEKLTDSFCVYVGHVLRHWRTALIGSIILGPGFIFVDLFADLLWGKAGRSARFWIVILIFVSLLVFATYRAWRDERRARMVQPTRNLAADAIVLASLLNKVIDYRQADGKQPHGPVGDYILKDVPDIPLSEESSMQFRYCLRDHRERLADAGIRDSPIDSADEHMNASELRVTLKAHV